MKRKWNTFTYWFVALFSLALLPAWVCGQGIEVEPNDPCPSAQDFGYPILPNNVIGELGFYDVDFFRFEANPGQQIVADLEGSDTGQGTLSDPFLGLFDANCTLVASDDDGGDGFNARLVFPVPADGTVVLAASACCDWNFDGSHGGFGSYTLTVAEAPDGSSVSGRVVDAVTGGPVPAAYVELQQCLDDSCDQHAMVAVDSTDDQGRFLFEYTIWGDPLLPGSYKVQAIIWTPEYRTGSSAVFELLEGQDLDIGDVVLPGPPVVLSDVVPCAYVPAIGGECEYSVRITNTEPKRFRGAAWSLVDASLTGSYLGYTNFQVDGVEQVVLAPGASTEVEFELNVPGTVPQGTYICPDAWVGLGLREEPYFFTLAVKQPLFCIQKGITDSYTVITGAEAQAIVRQLKAQQNRKLPLR